MHGKLTCRGTFDDYDELTQGLASLLAEKKELDGQREVRELANAKGTVTQAAIKAKLSELGDEGEAELLSRYIQVTKDIRDQRRQAKTLFTEAEALVLSSMDRDPDSEMYADLQILREFLGLLDDIASLKAALKVKGAALDKAAYEKYPDLTKDEIKALAVDDRWLANVQAQVEDEMDRISYSLAERVGTLAARYEAPLHVIVNRAAELDSKVAQHLERMGFSW